MIIINDHKSINRTWCQRMRENILKYINYHNLYSNEILDELWYYFRADRKFAVKKKKDNRVSLVWKMLRFHSVWAVRFVSTTLLNCSLFCARRLAPWPLNSSARHRELYLHPDECHRLLCYILVRLRATSCSC